MTTIQSSRGGHRQGTQVTWCSGGGFKVRRRSMTCIPVSRLAHTWDVVLLFLGWGFDRTLSCCWSKHFINIFFTTRRVELPPVLWSSLSACGTTRPFVLYWLLPSWLSVLIASFILCDSFYLTFPTPLSHSHSFYSFFSLFPFYPFSLIFF